MHMCTCLFDFVYTDMLQEEFKDVAKLAGSLCCVCHDVYVKNLPWRLVSEICCSADVTSGKLPLSTGISPFSIGLEEST